MVAVFFADTVKAKARQTSTITSFHHLSEPLQRLRNYAGVIRIQHAPHRTTNIVHSRLRSHRHRGLLQVHQLGEDGRILAESLEDIVIKKVRSCCQRKKKKKKKKKKVGKGISKGQWPKTGAPGAFLAKNPGCTWPYLIGQHPLSPVFWPFSVPFLAIFCSFPVGYSTTRTGCLVSLHGDQCNWIV